MASFFLGSPLDKISTGLAAIIRGDIDPVQAAREVVWRGRQVLSHQRERTRIANRKESNLRDLLDDECKQLSAESLLDYFRQRESPAFFPGFQSPQATAILQRKLFPAETEALIQTANSVVDHRWPLLGFGEIDFGESINWRRDPLSEKVWPLDYHADVALLRDDGSDVRVLWELNRLGHFITLGRALAVTGDEKFAQEICAQLGSWRNQNPVGQGPNWSCAMEVALRAMNLLATLVVCLHSATLTAEQLELLLKMLEAHGSHIERNLEFSYLGNSNHYLTDIVGLLWLGVMLPELKAAAKWRSWALRELLREMDRQILPDGTDHEGSTGYHRYVLELFLYSFLLCRENKLEIERRYWQKLAAMLGYLRAYLRPDGHAPLIGDTDGGQVLPVTARRADDHEYLLAMGAAVLGNSDHETHVVGASLRGRPFGAKDPAQGISASFPEYRSLNPTRGGHRVPPLQSEAMLWLLGEMGVSDFDDLAGSRAAIGSKGFVDAGVYVMRNDDLYLLFNAARNHRSGLASHRHNDALSIEIAIGGAPFIVDPGTYVYTADLDKRHRFRSTEFHSAVAVDGVEQNKVDRSRPFAIGNDARPRLLAWQPGAERDFVSAEHFGYRRLREPVTHRRSITFHKSDRWWLIEDDFAGGGTHEIATYFHFDTGLEITTGEGGIVVAADKSSGLRLLVCPLNLNLSLDLLEQFTSVHYGAKSSSVTGCWKTKNQVPFKLRWAIVPVLSDEDLSQKLSLANAKNEFTDDRQREVSTERR